MGRRPINKKPPPPQSVDWSEYRPDQAQYWMYGGPWIAPEDVPPDEIPPDRMGGGMTGEDRKKYIRELMKASEEDLERQLARYQVIHERGMEAIEPFIVENWRQRCHSCSVKPGEPDPVSQQLASCYRSIRYSRGRIKAGDVALNGLECDAMPLLFWKG